MTTRKRLQLHAEGNTKSATLALDGEPITFVSRVELVLDCNGESTVRLTVPMPLVDVDVDVAAFVTAHADPDQPA